MAFVASTQTFFTMLVLAGVLLARSGSTVPQVLGGLLVVGGGIGALIGLAAWLVLVVRADREYDEEHRS
jgi:hypothetical protein